jgi:hypothetical protein
MSEIEKCIHNIQNPYRENDGCRLCINEREIQFLRKETSDKQAQIDKYMNALQFYAENRYEFDQVNRPHPRNKPYYELMRDKGEKARTALAPPRESKP